MYFTYLVKTVDNTLYCGFTNNLQKRMHMHKTGKSRCKYIQKHPFESLYIAFEFETEHEARSCEWYIKTLTRQQKLSLIDIQSPLVIKDKIFNFIESYKTIPNN